MSKKFDDDFIQLEELIRKAYRLASPFSYHDDLDLMTSRSYRKNFMDKHPKCYLPIRMPNGRDMPFFPVCNRMGMNDPDIIGFSLKVARKLSADPRFERDQIDALVNRLLMMHQRFNKDIPKPYDAAARKGKVTNMMNKIMAYLRPRT